MFMLGCGAMLAADAAGARELAFGIKGSSNVDMLAPFCHTGARRKPIPPPSGKLIAARPLFAWPGGDETCTFYAALPVNRAAVGSPSSIGSEGSRDHSFQEPKYIRTSFTPAFFSARNVFEARAPLKQ